MDAGAGPWESGMYLYNQCGEIPLPFTEVFPDINAMADFVGIGISEIYASGSYTYTIIGTTITWTFTWQDNPVDNECGALVLIDASEFATRFAPFIPITPTLCPTCKDIVVPDCINPISLFIPGLNGFYDVQIENHQTGIIYTQGCEFDAGGETNWDTSATPGLFNPFSVYTLTVLDGSNNPISWLDGSNEYNCIRFSFKTFVNATPEG